MHVVASGPGSGKSTSAKAFMLAVVREGLKDKYPLGCAFVVQHIETAADAYEELKALLADQVAVWSSEHDDKAPPRQVCSEWRQQSKNAEGTPELCGFCACIDDHLYSR